MTSLIARFAVCLPLVLFAGAAVALPDAPERMERRLANGLLVTVTRDDVAPAVAVLLSFPVGSGDDPMDAPGMAHLMEHLYVRGVPSKLGLFSERAADLDGRLVNGSTDFDRSLFYWTVPAPRLDAALALEAERAKLLSATLVRRALDRERIVVEAELGEESDLLDAQVKRAAFPIIYGASHPYAHLPGGTVGRLDKIDIKTAKRRLADRYNIGRAHLVIVGDVDPAAAMALVERRLASLPPLASKPRQHPLHSAVSVAPRTISLQGRSRSVTLYKAAPSLKDPSGFALERGVGDLQNALARRSREAFGVTVASSLWYRPSEKAGNLGMRLVLGRSVDVRNAQAFLDRFVDEVRAGRCDCAGQSNANPVWLSALDKAIVLAKGSDERATLVARVMPNATAAAVQRAFSGLFTTILVNGLPLPDGAVKGVKATVRIGLISAGGLVPVELRLSFDSDASGLIPLHILAQALGGGTASLLDRHLRDERGWTYGLKTETTAAGGGAIATIRFRIAGNHLLRSLALANVSLNELAASTAASDIALERACRVVRADPALINSEHVSNCEGEATTIAARALAAAFHDALARSPYETDFT
jgi:predicted Zn-dependent peptidase